MSDVEAVSLPAALDVSPNARAAVKPDPPPPGKAADPPRRVSSDGPMNEEEKDRAPSPTADSEAETIIQSGRESLSPEKKRKHLRHDPHRQAVDGIDGNQRKKPRIDGDQEPRGDRSDRSSRSPSPTERDQRARSPPSVVKVEKSDDAPSVPGDVAEESGGNDVERPRPYRKRSFSDSVDESRERRPDSATNANFKHVNNTHLSRPPSTRSLSPTRHSHQRSVSGSHLNSRKKAPTPLLTGFQRQGSEDRQSTSSSASGSPLPSAHLRRLGSGVGASASPAKQMGPKKLRDKSGRTLLARACADRKYDQVVQRHEERPEDLDIPDNAGNTPLQIAALNGETSIVEFLLKAGCRVDTQNIDKDTPLIDAVENGHVEVVKLLLEAGANPRTVNASGDEPYELVPSDLKEDEFDEIRKALADAKANTRLNRKSEEQTALDSKTPLSRRQSIASPSRSPPPMAGSTSRRKTGRSEATRNEFLWTQATPDKLREYAAKGDEQGVVSVLNILQKADNASLIAAAKGGHEDVLSLMYAMGDADADPSPLKGSGHKPGHNTPMLAAIGRGKPAIIQLILNQPGFNPTRRLYEDRTYFEISEARQGENWEEEYEILKAAYDGYSGSGKARKDLTSPRRARVKEKDDKRYVRRVSSSPVPRQRKPNDSPDANRRRVLKDIDSLKEKRREKERASGTSSRRDTADHHASSDHDSVRPDKAKAVVSARRDSESSGVGRTDEHRKRRLIAGRRPQERENDRRPSLFSSDSLSGREDAPKIRNDPAPDAVSSLKRIRADTSPERSRSRDANSDRLSPESRKKKRRVVSDEKPASASNGNSRKPDDAVDGEKSHDRRPQEHARIPDTAARKPADPLQKGASARSSPEADSAKRRGDVKAEPPESNANAVPETPSEEKRAELEEEKVRRAEAKKVEEERAAEEKRVAEEAERARLAKEEEERAERAARAAREKAEEDERKRKEAEHRRAKQAEDERQKRFEQERARMRKIRRDQEAQEQRRRDALPGRLRASANLVGSNNPRARSHPWLRNFMPLVTVSTHQLEPTCAGDVADEKWIPNYLVAPLLATNDIQLSQYASWEKRRATPTQRMNLWRCTRRMLVYTDDPKINDASFGDIMQLDCDTRPKYFEMEHVFWIRVSVSVLLAFAMGTSAD